MNRLNETILQEMNKYLDGTTIEEILLANRKLFRYRVSFTQEELNQEIDVLDLSVRASNCLKRYGFHTLDHLVNGVYTKDDATSKRQLIRIRNLGKGTADEILLKLFLYQFQILPETKKKAYMQQVQEANKKTA